MLFMFWLMSFFALHTLNANGWWAVGLSICFVVDMIRSDVKK